MEQNTPTSELAENVAYAQTALQEYALAYGQEPTAENYRNLHLSLMEYHDAYFRWSERVNPNH